MHDFSDHRRNKCIKSLLFVIKPATSNTHIKTDVIVLAIIVYELSQADQEQFLRESSWLSSQLARVFRADKMNVAALGNMVPQLHFHHVVRYQNDVAWPKPVWGTPAVPYTNDVLAHMRQTLMLALRGQGDMPFDWRMD